MNDDQVVSKILKLLENNTAFIGYALNGGIGTKINVRNTETGKTIQALSINVDSSGEVLVVKDSDDGKYKAVTFKSAEQVTERIIQIRKTKPIDDKKIIEYTEADIEVFYLFVKLVDTGSPVPTNLTSTWIRKGNSCTQFVGAYERCNYAAKDTINGVSYTGLPYKPYSNLNDCLKDDLSRDANSPHGSGKNAGGGGGGWRFYSSQVSSDGEEAMLAALTSHDSEYDTNYKKLFGYATILSCGGEMNLQGWEVIRIVDPVTKVERSFFRCDFSYLPGYTLDCSPEQQAAGYCDSRGFINSKCPLLGEEEPDKPSVGNVQNDWGHTYGWVDLPYDFMYMRHFHQLYLNGQTAPGGFYILEVSEDKVPGRLPPGFSPWEPGCPGGGGSGGPYNGTGEGRLSGSPPKIKKRDMKLSTHKAEIWLGSSKKEEAIKLYELGASDLFSGMYNAFIIKANETQVDIENRLQRGFTNTTEEQLQHDKFYENWNKNIIDLNIDPRVWIYVLNNYPKAVFQGNFHDTKNPQNFSLQLLVDNLYHRTLNLSVIDNKTQVVHLKLNLKPANTLSNTDCKGDSDKFSSQSWEYQKYVTIKIKDWKVTSTNDDLNTSDLDSSIVWNKENIERKFLTSFGTFKSTLERDSFAQLLSRNNSNVDFSEIVTGNHFEQYNYSKKKLLSQYNVYPTLLYASNTRTFKASNPAESFRYTALSTVSWWEMWDKTHYDKKEKRLSSIVGFDLNEYQILRSSKLSEGLIYSENSVYPYTNAIVKESYFEYLPNRPIQYNPSTIKAIRDKISSSSNYDLSSREAILNSHGLNFYFSDWSTGWSSKGTILPFLNTPSNYYLTETNISNELKSLRFDLSINSLSYSYGNKRLNTRRWTNVLWSQFIYDGFINVDIESYKEVEFTLPADPSTYIKYTNSYTNNNSEYNFSEQPEEDILIETVLSPGKLEISKQVKITKPTNVDLDPNYSFLVYAYPFVKVTKKTKEI